MIVGGGGGWICLGNGSVAASSRSEILKIEWIFMETGTSSL